jgi:hypothetical protein
VHAVVIPVTFNDKSAAKGELDGLVPQVSDMPGFLGAVTANDVEVGEVIAHAQIKLTHTPPRAAGWFQSRSVWRNSRRGI